MCPDVWIFWIFRIFHILARLLTKWLTFNPKASECISCPDVFKDKNTWRWQDQDNRIFNIDYRVTFRPEYWDATASKNFLINLAKNSTFSLTVKLQRKIENKMELTMNYTPLLLLFLEYLSTMLMKCFIDCLVLWTFHPRWVDVWV